MVLNSNWYILCVILLSWLASTSVTEATDSSVTKVRVAPSIDVFLSSSDVMAKEGSDVTLVCRANGFPRPIIKWRRRDNDSNQICFNNIVRTCVQEFEGEMLKMTRLSRLEMGTYVCTASNGVGKGASKSVQVKLTFPPLAWTPNPTVVVAPGRRLNVSITCEVEAYPSPIVYWTREDELAESMIVTGTKYHVKTSVSSFYKTSMSLLIIDLQYEDIGTYKCKAKNAMGESDQEIHLYTSSQATAVDTRAPSSSMSPREKSPYFDSVAPFVWTPKQSVEVSLDRGVNVSIDCFVLAHPKPIVYWTKKTELGESMIDIGSKYHLQKSVLHNKTLMNLVIKDVQYEDIGTYRCVAKNAIGQSDQLIRLYASSPPTTLTPEVTGSSVPSSTPPRPYTLASNTANAVEESSQGDVFITNCSGSYGDQNDLRNYIENMIKSQLRYDTTVHSNYNINDDIQTITNILIRQLLFNTRQINEKIELLKQINTTRSKIANTGED